MIGALLFVLMGLAILCRPRHRRQSASASAPAARETVLARVLEETERRALARDDGWLWR